ncbi:MAG: PAS domain-containing protein [Rhodospirillaceae bacterium]|nr:PAS domain-containing protein [Rhodospirillaceae bacterium]
MRASRWIARSAGFALPGAVALLLLVAVGWMPAGPALLAGLAGWVGIAAFIRAYDRDGARLAAHLKALADAAADHAPPPPRPGLLTAPGDEALPLIRRLDQAWRGRAHVVARERDRFAAIVAELPDPLILVDAGRVVRRANPAAARLLGDRVLDRDLADSLRHPDVLEAVGDVLAGGGPHKIEITQPVPIERVFEVRVKRFTDDGGMAVDLAAGGMALVTLHDITAIKRSEQMRADFVANASHELRTPLSTLIGFLETLRGPARDDGEARDRFLAIMAEQAGRMARLIDDLLSLSRIELDEHTTPTGRVDLVTVLGKVIDMLALRAQDRGMSIDLMVRDPLPWISGDEDQLTQVFQNLIVNAIKYARAGTAITVTACLAEAELGISPAVAVSVADVGDGIPRAHLPRLTERFYRVDPGRSRALGGTGLGLAIVKHILSRHRGRLTVDSRVGQGSTFTVVLPLPAKPPAGVTVPGTPVKAIAAEPEGELLEP